MSSKLLDASIVPAHVPQVPILMTLSMGAQPYKVSIVNFICKFLASKGELIWEVNEV